ncbi:MAG TPA: ImmA/IrrE family metallo-endopeptidase [Terriglobales bacterium]|jgi:HTH-type transcriptional regulator/antitoxin HigA|nr:ImmA/IrrE family metallo-endopeptidase [Terriglobales bacterium]
MAENPFKPDWVSCPGETMADILEERSCSSTEFAQRMGYSAKQVSELLKGRTTISFETACRLELVLGATADFWIAREAQYSGTVAHAQNKVKFTGQESWLSELPLKDMRRYGWLAPDLSVSDPVTACLRFFGVADVQAWRATYHNLLEMAAFRTSPTFHSQPGALAAWMRQGEIESAAIDCKPWHTAGFQRALSEIRPLTRKRDPRLFIPELTRCCAEHGVAVVIVRAPEGCRASGATRFLSEKKALLLLSFRYLSDDHFWFTFFHEAAHLLLHSKKALFLEGEKVSSVEEDEANEFAAHVLVPSEFQDKLEHLPVDRHDIRNFARMIGVSPGIILGQLQHLGRARRNQLDHLKVRFSWE